MNPAHVASPAVNSAVYTSAHVKNKQLTHTHTHQRKNTPTRLTPGALTVTDLLLLLIASGMNTADDNTHNASLHVLYRRTMMPGVQQSRR